MSRDWVHTIDYYLLICLFNKTVSCRVNTTAKQICPINLETEA